MSIGEIGRLTSSGSSFSGHSFSSKSIDEQIDKLKAKKHQIEQDLKKSGNNAAPVAARGKNDANRQVNKKRLEQIEQQIQILVNRKKSDESAVNLLHDSANTAYLPKDLGKYLDIRA